MAVEVQEESEEDEEDNGKPKTQMEIMMKDNDQKMRAQELVAIKTVDNITQGLAKKLGFSYVPWFTLTKVVLGIYTALTCAICFYRPDFLNLTICTAAIFMILNTDMIKKWTFRVLVLGIFMSLLYDLFFFMI